jgi:hypothetical protein
MLSFRFVNKTPGYAAMCGLSGLFSRLDSPVVNGCRSPEVSLFVLMALQTLVLARAGAHRSRQAPVLLETGNAWVLLGTSQVEVCALSPYAFVPWQSRMPPSQEAGLCREFMHSTL